MKRRAVLKTFAATMLGACVKEPDWCEDAGVAGVIDDGAPGECHPTQESIEGPYYREGAPERSDLNVYGDEGTPVRISGRVVSSDCLTPVAGAVVEVWHADPDGEYDNDSDGMRYRGRITTDDDGAFEVKTLLPGLYLNGNQYRPRHWHIKVLIDGQERLTTQLYQEGDPYIDCDPFAYTSLVIAFTEGAEGLEGVFEVVLA